MIFQVFLAQFGIIWWTELFYETTDVHRCTPDKKNQDLSKKTSEFICENLRFHLKNIFVQLPIKIV